MRALHVVRPNALTHVGGDIIMAQSAGRALRDLGVDVDLVATDAPDARGYDLAHVFGIFHLQTAARQIAAIRATRVPLVLSPIWLDLRPYFAAAPFVERALRARSVRSVERRLATLRRRENGRCWRGKATRQAARDVALQRELMLQADVVLPASEVEAYRYGEQLRIESVPYAVAPVGTDEEALSVERSTARSGVLCVGRVESKKNQAALLYALRDVDVEVTIVGREYDPPYSALCRRWATPRTRFAGTPPRDELLAMMGRAAVHAYPAWVEIPGLASIEAAAAGARVVSGDRGCEREYLGPEVDYADPSQPASIRDAVARALGRGPREPNDPLERRLRARTWRAHAEATLAAYQLAVAR
jgi:glycosyltransferase involved in cell wall biosynthesis